ncbi:MAG: 3-deoxy-manno-octulosonate cytidylyltransferase [Chlamydiia bacterium]|nr:3-deoxy-manno-octulosonate cytidylyltransferase [Chlamydiia bacterium]
MAAIALIPARWGSSRFPGKMLAPIAGRSLILRTVENVLDMDLFQGVCVLTDDVRIAQHVMESGIQVRMTSASCPTGTDRLIEACLRYPELLSADVIVNVQGDEPCIRKRTLSQLLECLEEDPSSVMATPITRLGPLEEVYDPSVVKCVVDATGHALYFSRAPIPFSTAARGCLKERAFKHVGVYAYRREFLLRYGTLRRTPLQEMEDLEQLKVIEHGYRIRTTVVEDPCLGVNTPEDIRGVEQFICNQNTSSSPAVSALV